MNTCQCHESRMREVKEMNIDLSNEMCILQPVSLNDTGKVDISKRLK